MSINFHQSRRDPRALRELIEANRVGEVPIGGAYVATEADKSTTNNNGGLTGKATAGGATRLRSSQGCVSRRESRAMDVLAAAAIVGYFLFLFKVLVR